MTDENAQVTGSSNEGDHEIKANVTNDESSKKPDAPPKAGATQFYKEQANTFKTQMEQMIAENKKLQAQIEENTFKSMQEKEQHKELADAYRQKYEEERKRNQDFSEFVTYDKKISALKTEAIKQGIRQDALKFLDREEFDTVQVESTSSGNFNVTGVESAIEAFKLENKFLFTDSTPPRINNNQPGTGDLKNLNGEQLLKLQKDNPKEYQRIMMERLARSARY